MDLDRLKIKTPGLIPVRYWNDLIDAVKSALITSFVGGAYARTGVGTALWARGGGEVEAAIKPLQIIITSETVEESTATALSIYPGTVGGIYPKLNNSFIWTEPAPKLSISLPGSGGVLGVWLKCTVEVGLVTEAIVETGAELPDNTDTTAYVALGGVNSEGMIYQDRFGPIGYVTAYRAYEASGSIYTHEFY